MSVPVYTSGLRKSNLSTSQWVYHKLVRILTFLGKKVYIFQDIRDLWEVELIASDFFCF